MKVERSQVTKLTISDVTRLDPFTVFAEDIGPRQGKIVIECYGKSWSAYWGGMGEQTVAEFFASCSPDYIAGKMTDEHADITDAEAIEDGCRRQIIVLRRGQMIRRFGTAESRFRMGRGDITPEKARELWEEVESARFGDDGWGDSRLMREIFGDEWWYSLPTKPNPSYQYLIRIIETVQTALREHVLEKEATHG